MVKPKKSAKKPAKKVDKGEPAEMPDVERGDHIYFRHEEGPCSGEVICHGKTGATVNCQHGRHKVRWAHMLGHKVRLQPNYRVVDEGEDGAIVEDGVGRRRYISDPDNPKSVSKSLLPTVLLLGAPEDFNKAIKNGAGLSLQSVTDKKGIQTKRWKKNSPDEKKGRKAAAEEPRGSAKGYGTHNMGEGDTVAFKMGSLEGSGEIVGEPGNDGAHVRDSAGRVHQVLWSEVTGHTSKKDAGGSGGDNGGNSGVESKENVAGDDFVASDYAAKADDASATPESILKEFPPDTADKIMAAQERLASVEQTIDQHMEDGKYSEERRKLHQKIYAKFMSPTKLAAAAPANGAPPTLTMLGGRGGSGKGWFKGKVYDPARSIVLDADEVKKMLPEYEGWNAAQVHEESSQVLDALMQAAIEAKVNVVIDATMRSARGSLDKAKIFKDAGYRMEAHYMFVPRQIAAKRAVDRFLGKTQRYVPIDVVLGNKDNEKSFDQVRQMADAWSFRDNSKDGGDPRLVAQSGKGDKSSPNDDDGLKDDKEESK